jgi:hypothetical protein
MSQLSEKVRVALFTKMNVSSVTNLATGGVHHILAPEIVNMPYVVFNRQAADPVVRAFKQTLIAESDLWLIKAISDENSSTTKEPQQLNEDILNAVETAIGNSLTLAGGSEVWSVERVQDIPEFMEVRGDRAIYYNGFLLRVWSH